MENNLFTNKKTKETYLVIHRDAIDTTNSRDGTPVVVYMSLASSQDNSKKVFVRELDEFLEKFMPAAGTII